jgi:hypothetical protein
VLPEGTRKVTMPKLVTNHDLKKLLSALFLNLNFAHLSVVLLNQKLLKAIYAGSHGQIQFILTSDKPLTQFLILFCYIFSVTFGPLIVILIVLIVLILCCSHIRGLFLTFSHVVRSATRLHFWTSAVQYFY